MTEAFDPYRKWLGIPEQERPPNHYRLLGIELFESDADVISNAADGRMAQLKNYQAGKYSAYSQRLLNEIAAAKVCLLHPARKMEYDRQLKEKEVRQEERSEKTEAAGEEMMEIAGIADFASTRTSAYAHHAGRRHSRWFVPLLLTGGAVLFIAFLAFWTREDAKSAVAKPPHSPPAPLQSNVPAPVKPEPAKPAPAPEKPPVTEEKKPEKPAKQAEPAQLTLEKPTPSAEEPTAEPPAEKPTEPAATEAEADKKPKKLPVPEEAKQQAAEAKIREIFGGEIAAAKNAEQKLGVASKLVKQAAETSDDADARFVLYRMACNLAAEAGELSESFRIVDTIAESYDLNSLTVKTALLAKAVEGNRFGGKSDGHANALINAVMALLDESLAADNFEAAGRIVKMATTAVRATKDPQMIRDMAARAREVERLKAKFTTVKKAMDDLAENPGNAEANLSVGQWYCLTKGDWPKGLPLLQKGSDEKLAKQAAQDLANPKNAKEQTALADGWWELAEAEQGPSKSILQARASHWYEAALPKLTGLEKLSVEKRLESLSSSASEEKKPDISPPGRGVVQKGNVALASNGAKVTGAIKQPECLLDGISNCSYKSFEGTAWGTWPCEWIITLDKVYRLQEIRFRLWDGDKRFYNYAIAVSTDGKNFAPVADRSQGQWVGWQQIQFSPRPVKAIKFLALHNSKNQYFSVIEFEAYCLSPDRTRK